MTILKHIFFFLLLPLVVMAQDIPKAPNPPRLVNDFVGMLSEAEKQLLEQKLVSMDDTTSTQIAIVVIPTVEPFDMNTYAVELGRQWGIGQKGKNNGNLILWATDDRKVYIATGYGVEGALPDAYAKRVVDQIIIPNFKEGQYYRGLDEGTSAIMKYVSGEFDAEPTEAEDFPIWVFILMLIIIYIIIKSISKNGGNRGGGMRNDSSWPYTTYTGWGRHSGNWTGGGFGGGWSGGGGGGGFGGFGGGSFGGGGAGGSY